MTKDALRGILTTATSAAFGLLVAATVTAPAMGYDYRMPASQYGQVRLASKQSLGASDIVAERDNVFEPVGELREDDPLRRLTRAVGRLDLLVEDSQGQFATTCTGTIVNVANGGEAVLTASHCIPGFDGKVVKASILLDYYDADSETIRLEVGTEPLANDNGLDYALAPLLEPMPDDIVPISISHSDVQPGERLIVIHYPAGLPKKLTQFECRATTSLTPQTKLRHRCDTLPGSSGAPILNANREIVGIHHTGGLTGDDPKSFNAGTRIVSILAATDLLVAPADDAGAGRAAAADATPPAADTAPAASAAIDAEIDRAASVDSLIKSGGSTEAASQTDTAAQGDQGDLNEMIGNQ